MKMKELHLEVLEMMERIRAKKEFQDFYYGVRVRETPTSKILRAKEGYIFLGTESYIWVPLSPIAMPENKTRLVGVALLVKNGEIVSAAIEVVVPTLESVIGRTDLQVAPLLKKITKGFVSRNPKSKHCERYYLWSQTGKSTQQILQNTESMLLQNLNWLITVLGNGKTVIYPKTFLYGRARMQRDVARLLKIRGNISDKTTIRLKKLYTQI